MSLTMFPFPVLAETPATGRLYPPRMQSQLLEEASKIIPDQQKLINVVSKRVRQLSQGHRPLVEVLPRMVYSDIALKELIDGKLTFREARTGDDANPLGALAK
jgi:DNA-directed RNA polymerase subunit omega